MASPSPTSSSLHPFLVAPFALLGSIPTRIAEMLEGVLLSVILIHNGLQATDVVTAISVSTMLTMLLFIPGLTLGWRLEKTSRGRLILVGLTASAIPPSVVLVISSRSTLQAALALTGLNLSAALYSANKALALVELTNVWRGTLYHIATGLAITIVAQVGRIALILNLVAQGDGIQQLVGVVIAAIVPLLITCGILILKEGSQSPPRSHQIGHFLRAGVLSCDWMVQSVSVLRVTVPVALSAGYLQVMVPPMMAEHRSNTPLLAMLPLATVSGVVIWCCLFLMRTIRILIFHAISFCGCALFAGGILVGDWNPMLLGISSGLTSAILVPIVAEGAGVITKSAHKDEILARYVGLLIPTFLAGGVGIFLAGVVSVFRVEGNSLLVGVLPVALVSVAGGLQYGRRPLIVDCGRIRRVSRTWIRDALRSKALSQAGTRDIADVILPLSQFISRSMIEGSSESRV
jgi:hypothetical protein